jgi:hypothetical protein
MTRAGICARVVAGLLLLAGAAGCGEDIQSPDLFVLTRTGEGAKLTLLVNYDGTIRCNGGRTRQLPDPLLLEARDLSDALNGDATTHLKIAIPANSVYRYSIELANGTITFPDTAGRGHPNLAQAELFTIQAAQQGCGLPG